jgi:hypothetical protein
MTLHVSRRTALGVCLVLALATLLGGLDLPARGYAAFQFAPFGLVAGLLGIVYVFALSNRRLIRPGTGWRRILLIAYWVAASATAFRVLLPPPGLVQVGLAVTAAIAAAIIVSRPNRESAIVWLGIVAVTLAVVKFALVPLFEVRSGLPDWGPFQLGQTANAVRDLFVAYTPQRPVTQAIHFGSLVCYTAALWMQWERESSVDGTVG